MYERLGEVERARWTSLVCHHVQTQGLPRSDLYEACIDELIDVVTNALACERALAIVLGRRYVEFTDGSWFLEVRADLQPRRVCKRFEPPSEMVKIQRLVPSPNRARIP